jgi:hypothetical protein
MISYVHYSGGRGDCSKVVRGERSARRIFSGVWSLLSIMLFELMSIHIHILKIESASLLYLSRHTRVDIVDITKT